MKKMRIENGKLIAYIQHQDVTTLTSIKDFVRGEIFREESILKGECDEEGYYRIEDLYNVNYIKGLPFIPNYDYLLKLDFKQVDALACKAIADYRSVNEILTRLCNQKTPLNTDERQTLSSIEAIDQALVGRIEQDVIENEQLRDVNFRSMAYCLTQQMRNYMYAVTSMSDMKREEMEQEAPQSEAPKTFSLRRIWNAHKNKKQGE
ncbi:MAG: hypothetical protein J6A15_04235 [Clostridia bacterium]|nr:hypothetical protein [Clostridia bacterium]